MTQPQTRALAEKALELNPAHGPTHDLLFGLQTRAADWSGARRTIFEAARAGHLPKDVFRRRDAVLALQQSCTEPEGEAAPVAPESAITAEQPPARRTLALVDRLRRKRRRERQRTA